MNRTMNFVPLKELCCNYKKDIVDGPFGSNLKRAHFTDEGIPVLKIQNIKPFEIVLKKMDYVSPQKAEELNKHSFRKGDIILTKLGLPLGISAIVENINKGIIVADLVRVRTDPNKINTKYLCYHLNSALTNSFLNSQQRGTTRPRIRISVVRELPILTPPLEEQKRIVKILDKAFEGIAIAEANTRKNLANAIELFDSYLNQVFTEKDNSWEDIKLGDVADFRNGLNFTKGSKGEIIKIVGVKDFQNYFWVRENELESVTTDGKIKEIDILKKDDILTVRSNGNKDLIGRCILVNELLQKTSHSGFTIRIRLNRENINPQFVVYFLKSKELREKLIKSGGGINISSLNQKSLSLLKLALPKLIVQNQIVEKIDLITNKTKALENIYQRKLEALAELRRSILQKAFTGQLTSPLSKGG